MKKIYLNILFIILATFSLAAHAEEELEKSLDAVVEVRISVSKNARTAERFGTNRVASGVVIDKTGHILTIGFQTIEAETVQIVGKDHKTVNAIVVAYDRNTGFGLLRATSPLTVTPMPFGSSSEVKKGDIILAVNKQDVDGMADFFRKVRALGKAGVDVPLRILQGIQIRDIVVYSTDRNQYWKPLQKEKQTSVNL